MKRALITGGAGFIGSHLVDRLVKEGWLVRVVDNLSSGAFENIARHVYRRTVELVVGDLKDPEVALKAVRGVDTVFHFAANPEVRVSTTDPDIHFRENVITTFNLLEAIRKQGVKELVFASSSSVYGEPKEIPVDESAPIRPVSVYGASKAACENLMYAYSRLYGIRTVILRYANVVGPRLRHGVVYDLLMKLKKDRRTLEVLGDGNQVRSYIYVHDAVEATMIAYENAKKEINVFNVSNKDWIRVDDVVNVILDELNLTDTEVIHKPVLHGVGWPGDVKKIALKINNLSSFGFEPKLNSVEAIRRTVKSLIEELNIDNQKL